MKRATIAVDIDEVLFPMAPTFLEFHNTNHGTTLSLDQMTSYFIQNLTGETTEQMLAKIATYLKTEHYTAGKPITGAVESIRQLHQRYNVVLITARHDAYRGSTERFISEYFGDLFDSLRYTHTLENPNVTVPKSVLCKEAGAIALIDDSLHNVTEVAAQGIEAILFGNYKWNETDQLPEGVTRCSDWPAVLEHFSEG